MCKSARRYAAFTLIELLVVVAIIALLISILLPSLAAAREQTRAVKCLSNLRSMGQGIAQYINYFQDTLPGGLHPAVYRNQGIDHLIQDGWSVEDAKDQQERYLTHKLREVLSDSSSQKNTVSDQIATCPTGEMINPESSFMKFRAITNRKVYPTDYVLNNVGIESDGQSGPVGGVRETNPSYYFGLSIYGNSAEDRAREARNAPKKVTAIAHPSEEWLIADAWYRSRGTGPPELQQEGPYQIGWTGESLPPFAPHGVKGRRVYTFISVAERTTQSSQARSGRWDGKTNALFLDSHAAAVPSKDYYVPGFGVLMYGFPGTKNPAQRDPFGPDHNIWKGYWR